jgi:PAS domain S-box-containing protein
MDTGCMSESAATLAEHDRRLHAERETERIFDLSLDLLCAAGFDGYFKRVNPAFERTLGYSTKALLEHPVLQFVHPGDRDRTRRALASLRRGVELVQFENRFMRRDGSVRWLLWSARPVPEEGLMYAAASDITDSRRAAEEQAALRRIAALVARSPRPEEVFSSVTEEVGRLLDVDRTDLVRYTSDRTISQVSVWNAGGESLSLEPLRLGGRNAATLVFETGRPVRIDSYSDANGPAAEYASASGLGSSVAAPINVEGRVWGFMIASAKNEHSLPAGSEERLAEFTELLATAIANAHAQAELAASRARVVATADETRRRFERDLHDGAQQRIVSLALQVRAARAALPPDLDKLSAELDQVATGLTGALDELREFARGIHPAALAEGGLLPSLQMLARRSTVPVHLEVLTEGRLPERVEVGAYYVVSEALANVAKHANASKVAVEVKAGEGALWVCVRDDGVGGADFARGSGLVGLKDRVEALGGRIALQSEPGAGTALSIELPLAAGVDDAQAEAVHAAGNGDSGAFLESVA